jgi:hypothetical protein
MRAAAAWATTLKQMQDLKYDEDGPVYYNCDEVRTMIEDFLGTRVMSQVPR